MDYLAASRHCDSASAGMPWHVYLLECADGTLYCGITRNVQRRLAQHNGDIPGGARYTAGRRPSRLLASRACTHKGAALKLEMAVKARPSAKKLDFLQKMPPDAVELCHVEF